MNGGVCSGEEAGRQSALTASSMPAARCSAYIYLHPNPKSTGNTVMGSTKPGREELEYMTTEGLELRT